MWFCGNEFAAANTAREYSDLSMKGGPLIASTGVTGRPYTKVQTSVNGIDFNNTNGVGSGLPKLLPPNPLIGATAGEALWSMYQTAKGAAPHVWGTGGSGCSYYNSDKSGQYNVDNFISAGNHTWTVPGAQALNTWQRYGVSAQAGAGGFVAYLNGSTVYTDPGTTVIDVRPAPVIGGNTAITAGLMTGLIGCYLLFNRVLTSTERADANTWLAANMGGAVPGSFKQPRLGLVVQRP
jgi:hypothetical protein